VLRDPARRPLRERPPPRPPRQEYEEYILEQIEDFKGRLSRDQLLAIADEAVRELEADQAEQLVLTEILMLEHVDQAIMRRLNLPTFRRWQHRHARRRRAQREPAHWGLAATSPVADLGPWDAVDGTALVVGARGIAASLYLAAHDWSVMFLEREGHAVEQAENRAASEELTRDYEGCVLVPGSGWFPTVNASLVVLDPVCLAGLDADAVEAFFDDLDTHTVAGGVHCLFPVDGNAEVVLLEMESFRARYGAWEPAQHGTRDQHGWFVAVKP
jgi:hypothetical protein